MCLSFSPIVTEADRTLGWKFHDQIQPVLDDYDRQINDIRSNGAHGELARMQAQDDSLGITAGNLAGQAVPRSGSGGLIPLAGPPRGYGDDPNFRPGGLNITTDDAAPRDPDRAQLAMTALDDELRNRHILGRTYSDLHDALGAWADAAQPLQKKYDTELASQIRIVDGGWQIGPANSNGSHCSEGMRCHSDLLPYSSAPGDYWGYIHTHSGNGGLDQADENLIFSPDRGAGIGNAAFVSLPDGRIYGWNKGMQQVPDKDQNFANPRDQYIFRPAKK